MKLIIDIPDEVLESKHYCRYFGAWSVKLSETIENGTPLPKGHGRLIDADAYRKDMMDSREFNFFKILDMQSTIVEADKENDNE